MTITYLFIDEYIIQAWHSLFLVIICIEILQKWYGGG